MSQNLQNFVKFQKFQLDNLVDFEKCCKTHIFLQKSVPIQPKTNNILPKFCQKLATTLRVAGDAQLRCSSGGRRRAGGGPAGSRVAPTLAWQFSLGCFVRAVPTQRGEAFSEGLPPECLPFFPTFTTYLNFSTSNCSYNFRKFSAQNTNVQHLSAISRYSGKIAF